VVEWLVGVGAEEEEVRVALRDGIWGRQMSVWGRGEGDQFLDHGGRRTQNLSPVLVSCWMIFLEVSIPTLSLGNCIGSSLEIASVLPIVGG
jgi:hypothetical protein